MGEVAKYREVEAPVEKVYSYWRDFTNFPNFMPNVKQVRPLNGDDRLTHWEVEGPAGMNAEWDAEITEDVPNEKIAWRSVEGSKVETNGVVRFDDRDGKTNIEVALDYAPPAGVAGEVVAKLWGDDPSKQVDEALDRFADIVRGCRGSGRRPSNAPKKAWRTVAWPNARGVISLGTPSLPRAGCLRSTSAESG